MINLLSNAIKFSKVNDTITVTVTTTPIKLKESKDVTISISVSDSGIGISNQDLRNMFKPFFKTTNSNSQAKNSGGHGLGLSIC